MNGQEQQNTNTLERKKNMILFFILFSFIGLVTSMNMFIATISLTSHPLLAMLIPQILLPGHAVFGILGYVALAFTFVFLVESVRERVYGPFKIEIIKMDYKKLIGYGAVILWIAALMTGAGNLYVEFESILSRLNILNNSDLRPDFSASLKPMTGLWVFTISLAILLSCVGMQDRTSFSKQETRT